MSSRDPDAGTRSFTKTSPPVDRCFVGDVGCDGGVDEWGRAVVRLAGATPPVAGRGG